MATLSGKQIDLKEVVRRLIELDADAGSAYRASANRLENPQLMRVCEAFQADHERHYRELRQALRDLGEQPPDDSSMRQVLGKDKTIIGKVASDKAVLHAMLANEQETNRAYEQALGHSDLTPALKALIERARDDERRHKMWLEGQLSFIGDAQYAFR